jgi:hypothetical protein
MGGKVDRHSEQQSKTAGGERNAVTVPTSRAATAAVDGAGASLLSFHHTSLTAENTPFGPPPLRPYVSLFNKPPDSGKSAREAPNRTLQRRAPV